MFIKVEILWFKDSVIKGKMVFKFMSKVYERETTDPRSEDAGSDVPHDDSKSTSRIASGESE